jgi:hypothetical protein
LLEKIALIRGEKVFGECRPDISLIDVEDKVLAVIELVDTHKPEENALQYYKANQITLIQINLTSDDDLSQVEGKAKNPDIVDLCYNTKCEKRDKYKISRQIKSSLHQCSHCLSAIPRFEIELDGIFGGQSSHDFSENEVNLVKSEFNNIIIRNDSATNSKYPIFDCEKCKIMRSRYAKRPF